MPKHTKYIFIISLINLLLCFSSVVNAQFSFIVLSDQRNYSGPGQYDTPSYFRGAVEAIQKLGKGSFILSIGDHDPPENTDWTIRQVLGDDFPWYPAVGNHELPAAGSEPFYGANMEWLRTFNYDKNGVGTPPDIVNNGPSGCPQTTYSFDYENAHFIVLNQYCDTGGDDVSFGDMPDHLYNWLKNDLAMTRQQHIFVFGHEPAFPQPDIDSGATRHMTRSLNTRPANRDRFWNLLRDNGVVAYFCGHTHNFSAVQIDGVWQLDSGHARGKADVSTPATVLVVDVDTSKVSFTAYRDDHDGTYDYHDILHHGTLVSANTKGELSFQEPADSRGLVTKDTVLAQSSPNLNTGGNATLYADGDEPAGSNKTVSALLYWDIATIAAGSIVREATITLKVLNASAEAYGIYALKRSWAESEATWNNAGRNQRWQRAGASGVNDRGTNAIGSFSPNNIGKITLRFNNSGISQIQSWVNNPTNNHGLIIENSNAVDGFDFISSESGDMAGRPAIMVRLETVGGQNRLPSAPWIPLLLKD